MSGPQDFTVHQATDPGTAPETLSAMAAQRPDLRQFVAANPSAPPVVLQWLGTLADPAVRAALARRPGGAPPTTAGPVAPAYGPPGGRPADGSLPAPGGQPTHGPPAPGATSPGAGSTGPRTRSTSFPAPAAAPSALRGGAASDNPYTAGPGAAPGAYAAQGGPAAPGSYGGAGGYGGGSGPAGEGPYPYTGPADPYSGPADPYSGAPAPYGAPAGSYGTSPPWDAPQPRRRTGAIVAAVVGGIVVLLVLGGVAIFALGSLGPQGYGDDAELDRLWDACEQGDGVACDDLYRDSPLGSEYEEFGDTCGYRYEPSTVWCESVL
ncbi:hypothetical protein V2J56_00725 [Georgenia sp. MJ206]|uniref:variant leucine-rich repeat-containing protein n=1 Tax=Georgenia wangjunii TaxID=3117730 RepID=UPI002F2692F6